MILIAFINGCFLGAWIADTFLRKKPPEKPVASADIESTSCDVQINGVEINTTSYCMGFMEAERRFSPKRGWRGRLAKR